MKSKKLVLSLLLAIAFTFGSTSMYAYADELLTPVETTSTTDIVNEITTTKDTQAQEADEDKEKGIDVDTTALDNGISITDETSDTNKSSEVIDVDADLEEDLEAEDNEDIEESSEVADEELEEADKEEEKVKETSKEEKEKKPEVKEEKNYTNSDLRLLASLIYAEAGNQSYKGKLAVANVVLNRVKSKEFWHVDTVKEVIYDSKWGIQFSVTKKNSNGVSALSKALNLYDSKKYPNEAEKKSMNQCIKAAKAAFAGENNIGNYLYFSRKSSYLTNKYSNHTIIGDHIFYNT